ncbi:hypothetical protein GCM10009720_18050 [Yaniella flava]|uniref:Uncharacterized protein n=1 Tax=Yaniella flava TaxID=287930 RepID=A0ABP5G0P8_9MICC
MMQMLLNSVEIIAKHAPLDKVTISSPQSTAILATPTLAYAGFAAGWLTGDIVRSLIQGG